MHYFVMYIPWPKQFKPWKVPTVVGSIVVVGVFTCCTLLHSLCALEATQMNIQHCLIWEFYEFELGHNIAEATKNICCVKSEDAVNHSTVTRCFKKFCPSCKNLSNQARSGKPKSVDSNAVLQAIEANLASSSWRVSGKLDTSQSSVVCHLHDFSKNIQNVAKLFTLP